MQAQSRIGLRRAVALAVLALATAACGGSSHATHPGWAPPRAAAISAVSGAPGTFVRQRPEHSMTANPDPRGPCGARLAQPSFTSQGLTVYASPAGAEVFIWSRRLPGQSVSRLVEAVSADIRPGCPAFLSRTSYARDQLNEFLGAVSLPDLGDQRVAFATRVRQNAPGSQWAYASEALIGRGDRLSAIMVVSTRQPDDAFVRGVAALASA
jgi:hypothetical protein